MKTKTIAFIVLFNICSIICVYRHTGFLLGLTVSIKRFFYFRNFHSQLARGYRLENPSYRQGTIKWSMNLSGGLSQPLHDPTFVIISSCILSIYLKQRNMSFSVI